MLGVLLFIALAFFGLVLALLVVRLVCEVLFWVAVAIGLVAVYGIKATKWAFNEA